MRRVTAVLMVLLLFGMFSISAAQTLYYRSNSIGQPQEKLYEIDLYDPETRKDYILSVTEKDQITIRELTRDERTLWTETVKTRDSRREIERLDANGVLIFSQQYNQGLLQREEYRLAGTDTLYELTYGQDKHLVMTKIVGDYTSEKSFFLEPSGQLRGLIHDAEQEQRSYSLLFDADTFALGHEKQFTVTYADEHRTIITRYDDGALIEQQVSYIDDEGRKVEEKTDYLKKSMVRKRFDAEQKLLTEELYSPMNKLKKRVAYVYDQQGRVSEKTETTPDEVLHHLYSYEHDIKTETVTSGDETVKIIRYLDNRQEHTLFIDGEFYATVFYGQNGTIEGITYE